MNSELNIRLYIDSPLIYNNNSSKFMNCESQIALIIQYQFNTCTSIFHNNLKLCILHNFYYNTLQFHMITYCMFICI